MKYVFLFFIEYKIKIIIKTIASPMMTIIDTYRAKEFCFSCPFIILPLIHYTQNDFYTQNEYKGYFIYTLLVEKLNATI